MGLIRRVTGVAPPARLVRALHRRMAVEPGFLTDLIRCLLPGGHRSLAALVELTVTDAADTPVTAGVFRREGEYWTIIYEAVVVRLRDSKGLGYLAQLLARPGDRIPAADLTAGGPRRRQSAEQARFAVTKALKTVVARLRACHPALASHLSATVRSGRACGSTPIRGGPSGGMSGVTVSRRPDPAQAEMSRAAQLCPPFSHPPL